MSWLGRLLAWDGMLPLVVWAVPAVLNQVMPEGRGLVMVSAVLLPIAAVVVRFYVGRGMIETNGCPPRFRTVQMVCLCLGLFVLMCLDSLLITLLSLNLQGPENLPGEAVGVIGVFVILYLPYLALLSVAMYPGSVPRPLT